MKVAILPGDGIGPEVTRQAVRVLEALDLPPDGHLPPGFFVPRSFRLHRVGAEPEEISYPFEGSGYQYEAAEVQRQQDAIDHWHGAHEDN